MTKIDTSTEAVERLMKERDDLQEKVARLDEALRHAERVMTDPDCEPGNSITNAIQIARAALAKIKGHGHD